MDRSNIRRRDFLGSSVLGATGLAMSAVHSEAAAGNKKRRVGLIGTGWYGKADLLRLIQVAPDEIDVVSLCDVDQKMVAEAAKLVSTRQKSGKEPKTYGDYRELLKESDLDIALIATPDHWHALPMIAAVEAGADVYVQKPVGVDVMEGKAMLDAARKNKRTVQVGTQRRSTPHLIDCIERVIKPGLLGDIAHAEVYCYYHMRSRKNPADSQPPAHLDYEMWTGPAPMRPYNELVHPRSWRLFMEYCNGIMGDMCVHMLDTVRWMLDLGWPHRISSTGGILVDTEAKANTPDTQTATFEFDDLNVVWTHRSWGNAPDPDYPWGATIYGSKGTLKLSVHKYDFMPRGKGEAIHKDVVMELDQYPEDKTEKDLERHVAPAIRGHMKDLLNCIDNGGLPVADIEQGHISSSSCVLANLSMQLGRSLQWDADTHTVVGDEEANKLLKRPYRAPWKHPAS